MKSRITNYIKAGYSCLYCVSYEEARVTQEIMSVAKELKYDIWAWTNSTGIQHPAQGDIPKTQDPIQGLNYLLDKNQPIPNKSIFILKDIHAFFKSPVPLLVRKMKDAINLGRGTNRTLIIIGCQLELPPELAKEIKVIHYELPSREELRDTAENLAKEAKVEMQNGDLEHLVDAGSGLTTSEFEDACALSKVEEGKFDPAVVQKLKADTVRDGGLLEIVQSEITLDDIGGLEVFKAEMYSLRNLLSKAAKKYGLSTPRPILAVGQPGTGKSLGAEALRSVFNLPLLRLEAGRLFGSFVGESEANWRKAFTQCKAIRPAVVHIDEVDGLFSGGSSSGRTDGGTTMRVIKAILQDLQFNAEGLIFYFTCNDVDVLPDPLIDRCDVWNVELPHLIERQAIWKIHIQKRGRKVSKFDIGEFAKETEGFSGRQIEQALEKAMKNAFNDEEREVNDKDILSVLKEFVPTSETMKTQIEARRARLRNCAKLASAPPVAAPSLYEKVKKKIKAELVTPPVVGV